MDEEIKLKENEDYDSTNECEDVGRRALQTGYDHCESVYENGGRKAAHDRAIAGSGHGEGRRSGVPDPAAPDSWEVVEGLDTRPRREAVHDEGQQRAGSAVGGEVSDGCAQSQEGREEGGQEDHEARDCEADGDEETAGRARKSNAERRLRGLVRIRAPAQKRWSP